MPDQQEPMHDGRVHIQHPHLAAVIERNIQTLALLRVHTLSARTQQDRMADRITSFAGQMRFIWGHVVWFSLWISVTMGWFGLPPFDPFPFGLLTLIVSLEAIFLATFVLISQNRLSVQTEDRANLALQIGLLTEYELTCVLGMLHAIQDQLGIVPARGAELVDLERSVKPEGVWGWGGKNA